MQMTGAANPLGLEVALVQPGTLTPLHGTDRPADLAAIAASMAAHGWQGAPVVIDDRMLGEGGYLITGHHRNAAAQATGTAIPVVTLADLCAACGTDLEAFCDGSYDSDWEAVFGELPDAVRAAYGIDW